jgi:hypothetical protein
VHAGHEVHLNIRRLARAGDDDESVVLIRRHFLEQVNQVGQDVLWLDDGDVKWRDEGDCPAMLG